MIAVEILDFDFSDEILVVDAERATRRILSTLLQRKLEYAKVSVAASAAEAIALTQARHFSLIITAQSLPDMSGVAFAKMVHTQVEHSNTPVVVISGDAPAPSISSPRHSDTCVVSFFDKSEGYQRLLTYLRWLSPLAYQATGRVLCVPSVSDTASSSTWQQLAQHEFNVQRSGNHRDVIAALSKGLKRNVELPDLLVLETSAVAIPANLELLLQIRHNLHLTPQTLPVLVALPGTTDSQLLARFSQAGASDFIRLPVSDTELLARTRTLVSLARQFRQIHDTRS